MLNTQWISIKKILFIKYTGSASIQSCLIAGYTYIVNKHNTDKLTLTDAKRDYQKNMFCFIVTSHTQLLNVCTIYSLFFEVRE